MNGLRLAALVLPLLAPPVLAQGFRPLIDVWMAEDALDPPPANALLFVGSSSIRKWERLQSDFSSYDVIQRGFGGSTMDDVNQYIEEIVLPYDPYAIVLYSGANAIVTSGLTPQDEFTRYQTFVDTVHSQQNQSRPPIPIFMVSITPAPARWSFWPQFMELNDLLGTFCSSDSSLHFIDAAPAFLATGSPPSASLFAPDGLHLSQAGYTLWTNQILPVVSSIAPSPRVYVPNPGALFPNERMLFDCGTNSPPDTAWTASPDVHGNRWNNWPSLGTSQTLVAGEHMGNLVTNTGRATGVDLVLAGGFQVGGISNGGLLNPSVSFLGNLAVETATQDYFSCVNLTTPATPGSEFDEPGFIVLNNLNRNLRYNVRLFASRASPTAQTTRYTLRGHPSSTKTGQVQTSGPGSGTTGTGNNDTVINLTGLRANNFGQLFIDVSLLGSGFAYLNAFEVRATLPPL